MDRTAFRNVIRVYWRQRCQSALRAAFWGLLAGAVAGIGAGLWRLLAEPSFPINAAVALLAAGPLVGALVGLLWPHDWLRAARAIDISYNLKDRTVTALEFVNRRDGSLWHWLQLRDATEHLQRVEPAQVVPLCMPRWWPAALAALTLAIALLIWPATSNVQARPQGPLPGIVAVAEDIQRDLERLDELAEQEKSEEL
ncbi:MAG: hypothetical protein GXP27_04735, partial [Planctomycetes bacterium]|nr:hypothetical protein [Planctomycetota bacterium]